MRKRLLLIALIAAQWAPLEAHANPLLKWVIKNPRKVATGLFQVGSFVFNSNEAEAATRSELTSALTLLRDSADFQDKTSSERAERNALQSLRGLFGHHKTGAETKSQIATLIGQHYQKKQESKLALKWYQRAIETPMESSMFSGYSKAHVELKSISAKHACGDERLEWSQRLFYCAVAYSYQMLSGSMKTSHVKALERCVVSGQKTECAHHGTRIISSLVKLGDDRRRRTISTSNNAKPIIAVAAHAFLPHKHVETQTDWSKLSNNTLIQLYWLGVAFEALETPDEARDVYMKLCQLPKRGDRSVDQRLQRSCDILSKSPFWAQLTDQHKASFVMNACLAHEVSQLCLASLNFSQLFKERAVEFITTVSQRFMSNGDDAYFLTYVYFFGESLNTWLQVKGMKISTHDTDGSKWDTFGTPEFAMLVMTTKGVLVYKTDLSIRYSDGSYHHITDPKPSIRQLPVRTVDLSQLRVMIYEKDGTDQEVILNQLVDLTRASSVTNSLVSGLSITPVEVSGDQLPYNRLRSK